MSDHVELSSKTGYEAFAFKKTSEFTNGASTFVELEIAAWIKAPNFRSIILQNEYCYENSITQVFDHFYIQKHKDSINFMIDGIEACYLDSIDFSVDHLVWESIFLSLQNKTMNKIVNILAKKQSEILIVGKSDVFVEISFFSTKFENTHRMVCNLISFTHFLKGISEIVFF